MTRAHASPRFFLCIILAVLSGLRTVTADDQEPASALSAVVVNALRLPSPIAFDGRLDDTVYTSSGAVTTFLQQTPHEGAPASERTEAWVFYDQNYLYVAARCWDRSPASAWVANEMRRDATQLAQNDTFGVLLDTFHDRRDGFLFYTNPLGALADQQISEEQTANADWNAIWDVKTSRFDGGWTVEMQIPFKSLRYGPGAAQTWGIQLRRVVRRLNEWSYITPVPISAAGRDGSQGILRVSQAATLSGLEAPPGSKNLEVKPYAIARLATDRTAQTPVVNDATRDIGVDVKYGLTQNITADLTYNTDFAQVEADQQQVNLTRFSVFFPEKREFFLEGKGIFDFGRPGGSSGIVPLLFFSRRIGLEDGKEVPIRAGGRVTGKAGAYTLGAINIQTGSSDTAASTNFTVMRLKRNVLQRSAIGALYTARSHAGPDGLRNQAFGVDTKLAFKENVNINAYLAKTETPGVTGHTTSYQAQFDYPADIYGARFEDLVVGRNFVPEAGFVRRSNFRRRFGELRYSPRPTSLPAVRQLTFEGSLSRIDTADSGQVESREKLFSFESEFTDSSRFELDIVGLYERLDEAFDVGSNVEIPVGGYDFRHVEIAYTLARQRKFNGQFLVRKGSFYNGHINVFEYSASRIEATRQLSVEPSISINRVELPTGVFTSTLGRARVSYTFTPRMFVSGLVQYNSETARVSSNVRLRWEYRPGSELFVVYSEDRDTDHFGLPQPRNRGLAVKFNRLFRY